MTTRIRLIHLFFFIWLLLIIARLSYWQIVKAADLRAQAQQQYSTSLILPASRGEILSSDGFPLVTNTENYLLYAQPQLMPKDFATLTKLSSALPASDSAAVAMIPTSHLSWLPLARDLDAQTKAAVAALHIPGLGFESQPVRYYPEGSSSAYITGFVGQDAAGNPVGYFGLEGYYNRLLSGKPGRLLEQQDAFARPILISDQDRIPPQDGGTITTSIDRTLQYLAWQELSAGIQKYQTDSGTISIMDTSTGRILAMVALPGYDPAHYASYDTSLYKNPVISDFYEPGSTFKTVVMSSALDLGAVTPASRCTICTGPVTLSGLLVHDYDDQYHPNSTMADIILNSDNVGMVGVAQKMGRDELLSYIRKFGFGKLTGIDLQEETTPELRPDAAWEDVDWGTAAFGQGIAVTRLQLLAAVNAIANHGLYMPPRLVTRITSGGTTKDLPPPPGIQVISEKAAYAMTQMMVNGVNNGEVRYYKPAGFVIAGKTGTAQVPIAGHYDPNAAIASFVGFAPADNPRFTMLVTLKNPKNGQWGSTTAAPLWFDLAQKIFRYYNISPHPN